MVGRVFVSTVPFYPKIVTGNLSIGSHAFAAPICLGRRTGPAEERR